jgi:uncharacterized protein YidB (DUF937 family)
MTNGYPSMTALLGLLAVAGYQNRDKLAEMLGGATSGVGGGAPAGAGGRTQTGGSHLPGQGAGQAGAQGGIQGGLGGLLGGLGGGGLSGLLGGGLSELVDRFTQNGHGEVAQSWVGTGPNREVAPPQLEKAIGPDVLEQLTRQTGLSRDEILARLSKNLPHAVDQYTPQGRLPTQDEYR